MMNEGRQSRRESISKRRLDFSHVSSPTYGKTFYLDVRKALLKEKVIKCIRHVGGRVEDFLSREVDMLVTDRPMSVSDQREATLKHKSVGNPSSPNCMPLPSPDSPNLVSQNGSSSLFLSTGSSKPLTRTQTLLMKAQQNFKSSQTSKVDQSSNSSVMQNAITLGIKVISVHEFLSKYQQQTRKLSGDDKFEFTGDPILTRGPARSTRGSCKRNASVDEKENKPCVKVEDFSKKYRPLYKTFDNLPEISYELGLNSRTSNSKKRQKIRTGNVSNFATPRENRHGDKSIQRPSTVKGPKRVQKGGYCESCDHWYNGTTREHLAGSRHQQFAKNSENYQPLDIVISKLPDLDHFLSYISVTINPTESEICTRTTPLDDDIVMIDDDDISNEYSRTTIEMVTLSNKRVTPPYQRVTTTNKRVTQPSQRPTSPNHQSVISAKQCMPPPIERMPPPIVSIPPPNVSIPPPIVSIPPPNVSIPPPISSMPPPSSTIASEYPNVPDVIETDDTPQTVTGRPKVLRKLLEKCSIAENSDNNMSVDVVNRALSASSHNRRRNPNKADELDGDIFSILNSINQQITNFETDDHLETKVLQPSIINGISCQPMVQTRDDSVPSSGQPTANNRTLPTLVVGDFNFGDTPNTIANKVSPRKRLDFGVMPALTKYSYDDTEKHTSVTLRPQPVIFGKESQSNRRVNLLSRFDSETTDEREASSPLANLEHFEQARKRNRVKEPSFKNTFYYAEKTSEMKLKLCKVKKDPLQRKRDLKSYWKVRKSGDCKLVFSPKFSRQIAGAERARRRMNVVHADDDSGPTTDTGNESDDTEPIKKRQRVAPL